MPEEDDMMGQVDGGALEDRGRGGMSIVRLVGRENEERQKKKQ
jgi:hypothetical protein